MFLIIQIQTKNSSKYQINLILLICVKTIFNWYRDNILTFIAAV